MLSFRQIFPLKNCNFLHLVIYLHKWYLTTYVAVEKLETLGQNFILSLKLMCTVQFM